MPTTLSHKQLLTLARHGAQARLKEIRDEIAAIERTFGRDGRRGRKPGRAAAGSATGKRRGKRRRSWSAAARKAAADRMRAYWAKRRAGRKK